MTLNAAFIVEQTLGHVTHARNLQHAASSQSLVRPTWIEVGFSREIPFKLIPPIGQNWSIQASWKARRAVSTAMRGHTLDALFFHSQVTSLFSVDFMGRLPTIVSLDATPINFDSIGAYYGHAASDSLLERAKFRLNRKVFHSARALVSWSEWAKRSLIQNYGVPGDRVRVIAPGAGQPFFEIGKKRLAHQATAERFADRPIRLLFVGGDFRRKGGPLLLECMRGPLGARCELHLVTNEPIQGGPNVFVHSDLGPNSPELLKLFEQADMLILPSMAECLAVVLMEATAAGLPVIATDVGALSEAVQDGITGLLVRAGDPRALERAITTLVDDAPLRQHMSRAGREMAQRKFDSQANGLEIFSLIAAIATQQPSARRAA